MKTDIKQILLIMNPVSGQQDFVDLKNTLKEKLQAQDLNFEIKITQNKTDAYSWSRQAEPNTLIIASGGDGTIAECINGIIKSDTNNPLAQIPVGTANILARSLELPTDPIEALNTAVQQYTTTIDTGYLVEHDHYFVLMASAGFGANLIKDANRELKNHWGFLAYIISGIQNLFKLHRSNITFSIDGDTKTVRAHTAMVINVGQVSTLTIPISEDISPSDGLLNILLIIPKHLGSVMRLLGKLLRSKLDDDPGTHFYTGKKIRISSSKPLTLQVDGEFIGTTPFTAEMRANSIRLVVPIDSKQTT
jgi:YegS/Rv2252/BmrU family lipid kinase